MKYLFLFITTVISVNSHSQNKLENGYFKTELANGLGQKIQVDFAIDSLMVDKISKHPAYLYWDSTTFSNPNNAGYIEKNKDKTHMEMFLMGSIMMGSVNLNYSVKNTSSYTPLQSKNNRVSILEYNNSIIISYDFQAQNFYGNMIFSTGVYSILFKDGKNVTDTTIF